MGLDTLLKENNFSSIFDDYEKVKDYTWYNHEGYMRTDSYGKRIKMHQLIMNEKNIDHKNGNRADNRKSNLRKIPLQKIEV